MRKQSTFPKWLKPGTFLFLYYSTVKCYSLALLPDQKNINDTYILLKELASSVKLGKYEEIITDLEDFESAKKISPKDLVLFTYLPFKSSTFWELVEKNS
jgi:hypothetical protein